VHENLVLLVYQFHGVSPFTSALATLKTRLVHGALRDDIRFKYNAIVKSVIREREMPLSEMDSASVHINPHHIHLWIPSVCALFLQILIYRSASCDNWDTVVVVVTTVLSRAAPGTTLVLTPTWLLLALSSAIYNCHGDRHNLDAHLFDFQDAQA
jgi:hypothetical protein